MDHSSSDAAGVAVAVTIFAVYMIVILAFVGFTVWCYWRIAIKAGYNGALSLLMLVPVANLIIMGVFAFTRWPIEERLAAYEAGLSPAPPQPPPSPPGTSVMSSG